MFLSDFVEKVAQHNSCNHCKERLRVCKNPEHEYNHYPIKIALILLNESIDKETDIDTVLSFLHSRAKIHGYIGKRFVDCMWSLSHCPLVFEAINKHWDCIDDSKFFVLVKKENRMFFYDDMPKDNSELMYIRDWIKQEFPDYFKE